MFSAPEFWSGYFFYLPGAGDEEIITRNPQNVPVPPGGDSVWKLTTHGGAMIRCIAARSLNTASPSAGQGFEVLVPDGTKYQFDHIVSRRLTTSLGKPNPAPGIVPPTGTFSLERSEVWILPTVVTDRYGNKVTYTWDIDNPNEALRWRLLSISDGSERTITLSYSGNYVSSVAAGGRTWTYGSSFVKLPDGSQWTYSLADLVKSESMTMAEGGSCDDPRVRWGVTKTGSITHPSGATAVFQTTSTVHGRTWVDRECLGTNYATYPKFPSQYGAFSLKKKTITGPGLPSGGYAWSYDYGQAEFCWRPDSASAPPVQVCSGSISGKKYTTVTGPDNKKQRYTYGTDARSNDGQVLAIDGDWNGASATRTTAMGYRAPSTTNPYPFLLGESPNVRQSDNWLNFQYRPLDLRTITQDGATFKWEASAFDARARPTTVKRSSTLSSTNAPNERTETTEYHDNFSKWILGQTKKVTAGTKVVAENDYNATTADLESVKEFGVLRQSLEWYGDGTLRKVIDGAGNATTFGSYKRGYPQSVQYADGTSLSASVNADGDVDWVRVPVHAVPGGAAQYAQTNYLYDPMGRLAKITYPADSVTWNATNITYAPIASAEFGLAAGHWRRDESTGDARRITYYDALWRPRLTREYDNADVDVTRRSTWRDFDHENRETFVSYPSGNDTWPTGTKTFYDGLGRIERIEVATELGTSKTAIQWLSPFQRRVEDPNGNVTTTSFQAFDEPSESSPLTISQPTSAVTTMQRDAFGKILATTRSGGSTPSVTRRYVYDAYPNGERLCKTVEPESGAAIQHYDLAGNVDWATQGSTLTGTTACEYASVAAADRTVYGHDARNRVTVVTYPTGTDSSVNTYYADGALHTTSNGPSGNRSEWTYTYNNRRLLESETLGIDLDGNQQSFRLDHVYDANGALSQRIYPDESSVAYAPNALGQPTQAGSFATGVKYFPNGAMSGFIYGNGIVHSLTQNARRLPWVSQDGSIAKLTYAYDANANVRSITDGAQSGLETRNMTYDGLDRLLTANAPGLWGNGSFTYDAQDNLRTATVGGRSCTYNYNALNQLTGLTGCTSAASSYTYDARGNAKTRGTQSFTFDRANRLTTGSTEDYRYDGLGRRVRIRKTASGAKAYQMYSREGELLWTYELPGGVPTKYVLLNGSLVAKVGESQGGGPAVPEPVMANPNPNTGNYTVSWANTGAAEYRLEEQIGSSWSEVQRSSSTSKAFSNRAVGTYGYRARACGVANNASTCTNYTTTLVVTVRAGIPVVSASPNPSLDGNYTVSWTPVSGAPNYRLEEKIGSGSWAEVPGMPQTATSKSFTGKPAGTYYYRARACVTTASSTCGDYSNQASETVSVVTCAPPTGVATNEPVSSDGLYTLTWQSQACATRYQVRETYGGVTSVYDASGTSWTTPSQRLKNGEYSYAVASCTASGCSSSVSATVKVTVVRPPVNPAVVRETSFRLRISFPAIEGTTKYRILGEAEFCGWTDTFETTSNSTPYAIPSNICRPNTLWFSVASCVGTVCGAYGDGNFIDIPSGNLNATTTTYVHTDALHSPIAETNASGVVTKRFRYEPWGAPTNGSYEQGPGYTGHVTDAATGLSYMQQRYYDPIGGRFLSVDPVAANPTSLNRYWYANNNPYKNIDPDGRAAIITQQKDGSVLIQFPTKFTGPAASEANISAIKDQVAAMSGAYTVNGKEVNVKVEITDVKEKMFGGTPRSARNEMKLVEGPTSNETGRSFAELGGKRGEIDVTDRLVKNGVAPHEFSHLGGVDDQYNKATGLPDPAKGYGIMNRVPGVIDAGTIEGIVNSKSNVRRNEK